MISRWRTPLGLHKHCEKCFNKYCQAPVEPSVSCVVISCRSHCGAVFHMCKEDDHKLLCPLEQVSCLNSIYGCPFTMARFKVAKHLQVCPASIVSCSMEWNRWPCADSEAILHENIMKQQPKEECLDVAIALRDQAALFKALKMAELFPECRGAGSLEETTDDIDYFEEKAVGGIAEQSIANKAEAAVLTQQELENLAKNKDGMDLIGYKSWENMFSKEFKACQAAELSPSNTKNASESGSPHKEHASGSTVEEASSTEGIEKNKIHQINLAAEKTGLAPWQDGVLERLKNEVPVGEYNMYLVHHGRMLIHFGQMPACTPREKDFVYGNLEVQELKTETTFRPPLSYCGKRTKLGDPVAHKKPSKSISLDTSELDIDVKELPKSNTIKTTLLCALEKELKGHEISKTKSTDALYIDIGTQTYSFVAQPFSSRAVLADILVTKDPLDLHLQLHSESVTQRYNKSSSAFTFSCNHFFRRDEFSSHFKNVHADIQSSLDGWFQRRCPLAYLGCTFVQYPWHPPGQKANVIYNPHLMAFAVKPEIDPVLSEAKKSNFIRSRQRNERMALTSLPLEILKYIAGFLDSVSLSQLAQVSVQMRDICATLLHERGMVFLLWKKKRYSHGRTLWRVCGKIWKFSTLFSTINKWQLSNIPSIAVHLKTCPFYEVEHKKDPILLTSMLLPQEQTEENLVSTFKRRRGGGPGSKKFQEDCTDF
ncbi:F-box only protein 40 [Protobothrops mucrosquamatus]|uniref:F-box only protein 40 n=1 Tax=Protobothrops mucrosquamatus TaxID=103944 RepID=UPI0007756D26|nr:F-box only protein 40 [Protobothrops mucrosquamatus]